MQNRYENADKLVRKHTAISVGCGLVPVPVLDMASVTANQIYMVSQLSNLYGIPFSENVVKSLIGSLLYSITSQSIVGLASSIFKAVPVIGTVLGAVSFSIYAGAATYAIGRVFTRHFESGGTLLDFDARKARRDFKQEFEQGKNVARDEEKRQKENPKSDETDK